MNALQALQEAAGDELARCSLVELVTAATALVAAVAAILGRRDTRAVKAVGETTAESVAVIESTVVENGGPTPPGGAHGRPPA